LEQQSWKAIKGDALFKRSFNFYEVSQSWAPPYRSSTASTELGIPLRLTSDANVLTTRSTVQETYDKIISDLKESVNLLPVTASYLTRASKPAAFALLARIYLSMGDYSNAGLYADSSFQLNKTLMDYNNLNLTVNYPIPQFNSETTFYNTGVFFYPLYYALVDTSIYNLYNINDLRRSAYFITNTDGTISFQGSYAGTYETFTGLANDEVYLIKAECYARQGNISSAMGTLNALLQKDGSQAHLFH